AYFDYEIKDTLEAGINLSGPEVKSVRANQVDLTGSHVRIVGSEVYLINAKIYQYKFAKVENYDEKRTRKLLLHKREIISLKSKIEGSEMTLVPVSLYTKHGVIKVEIGIAKGKKKYQKKEAIKKRDITRDIEREFGV
ncbi:SsrA-binding protein SmpB, partial [Patescibacteria group bacterium]|nr:SsrA-binding protein SmpB [Patescibacteria group bacterium]